MQLAKQPLGLLGPTRSGGLPGLQTLRSPMQASRCNATCSSSTHGPPKLSISAKPVKASLALDSNAIKSQAFAHQTLSSSV
ncbi:hypothetical protein COCSUDRAFT_33753 [Coccomyxa subellipsoidea C-169]|uniref:Uncharacterized protein n=1 Tax=Coccomyxa subellipsoidea (strain C-169) TaxID=574566 RepID=I0YTJ1_COCSC|nr:hypothetical protein COCSUDRAFT_33753 [Coccomyxa subellipsoidea C-169]EIE21710.1 hypothetical protein COCSUDRAFT_33753 [Coccomyxa subellipsoidea C-169]|eukprot:XP_005646254.1 hypothetical protein COCSUDRAFT_33753 [Coccomyxa subellipsoidea C-169]